MKASTMNGSVAGATYINGSAKRAPRKTKLAEQIDLANKQGIEVPSWKRIAAASIASFAINVAWWSPIVGLIAELTVSASMFMTLMIWALSIIIASYAMLKVSQYVGNYILSGQVDKDIVSAKNKVFGLFNSVRSKLS